VVLQYFFRNSNDLIFTNIMKVTINKWRGVASWKWEIDNEDVS